MKARAKRDKNSDLIIKIRCENDQDERIVLAIANSGWLGHAIELVFGAWGCPFYAALEDEINAGELTATRSADDCDNLKRALMGLVCE